MRDAAWCSMRGRRRKTRCAHASLAGRALVGVRQEGGSALPISGDDLALLLLLRAAEESIAARDGTC